MINHCCEARNKLVNPPMAHHDHPTPQMGAWAMIHACWYSTRGTSDALKLQVIDVHKILLAVACSLDPPAKNANLRISIAQVSLSLLAEPFMLWRACSNAVRNAIELSNGQNLQMTVTCNSAKVAIIYEDDDDGSPLRNPDTLMSAFETIDSPKDRTVSHTGLGLAIVNAIVEAHRAAIELDRSPMAGVKISFRVPIARQCTDRKIR